MPTTKGLERSANDVDVEFFVVGIGASAGGLEALLELFGALPERPAMAFVVVQHLEPSSDSQLAQILSQATKMPVVQATENQHVELSHVYVIPPNASMVIREGILHLAPRAETNKPHHPIDHFLESLAADKGSNAIGVILSGGASDGAQGIRAIKARFGITFAQSESSAKYGSMPHSAIATGAVDFVLSASQIAVKLGNVKSNAYSAAPVDHLEHPIVEVERDGELSKILRRLKAVTRVDFSLYKQSTIRRRIGRRLILHHFTNLQQYLEYVEANPAEIQDLYRDLLIGVTSFFREPAMFHVLTGVITRYIQNRDGSEPLRLWTPGCATGEETYSLAITAFEILAGMRKDLGIQVFGTDISDSAIERARSGIYRDGIAQELAPERLRQFFSRVDSGFRISQQIRDACIFARHDLTNDPPFSQIDIVSCRNVFIYLNASAQERVLPALHYSLKPNGLLVLGSAETIGTSDLFGLVDSENRIYIRKSVPARLSMHLRTPEGQPPEGQADGEEERKAPFLMPALNDMEAKAARVLRDLYAPAGVLINRDMQVLHFHGATNFYLEQVPGEASLNLFRLARESLVYPLRKAIETAFRQNQPAYEPNVVVQFEGQSRQIRLSVIPISGQLSGCMVLFEEQSRSESGGSSNGRAEPPSALEIQLSHAQRELSQMRDYLRKTVEQHEVTTEELRAANEEARSSNEELQSTNEELRTAKEELQSSNEELTTVNDELKHRNEELNVASNDLGNILSAATIPLIMVGMDLRLRRFTPAAQRLLGLTSGDVGRRMPDIQLTVEVPNIEELLLETIRTLAVQERNLQDRKGRWYSLFVRPYRTTDDRINGAVMAFIDVNDIVVSNQTAQRARNFAEGIVETVQHPLLVLDHELRVIRATSAFYQTFGVREEETIGHFIDDLGNEQWNVPELRRLLEQALVRNVPFRDMDIAHDFPHIGRRTMRLNARRISGSEAAASMLLLAIEDITERQETAEIQYRRLFESAKDAILILDSPSGIVLDANPFFLELTRLTSAEVLQRTFAEVPIFLTNEGARELVDKTIAQGTTRYDSMHVRARDGRELVLEIVANGYQVKAQSLIQLNIRDVTEKRRQEESLRRSNLDLQQFAFAASHDLQEPLRTINNYLQLLQRQYPEKLGPDAERYIGFITTAASRMRQLVLDLLGFSQVVRAELKRKWISVEAVLATVLLNLQLTIDSADAQITFDPLPTLYIDETQFMQLLQNLIGNAIKYRREATPMIHISAREAGPEWILSVRDNGIGIDPKYRDLIFTIFKRLHGQEYPGTGIGLAICKRVVEQHGGRIWMEPAEGHGSTFYFTVPNTPLGNVLK